jgi:hypothetical protein
MGKVVNIHALSEGFYDMTENKKTLNLIILDVLVSWQWDLSLQSAYCI